MVRRHHYRETRIVRDLAVVVAPIVALAVAAWLWAAGLAYACVVVADHGAAWAIAPILGGGLPAAVAVVLAMLFWFVRIDERRET